jgi:nucleoside-diphosphate-sugar epimerase
VRVVITGAAGGIGTAATAELRRRGAQVVGLDLQGADVVPRRRLDELTRRRIRALARRGHFGEAGIAAEFAARLKA